jgi:DNA-binding protein HU-beta
MMKKTEFVNKIASNHGITKKQASEELKRVLDTLEDILSDGDSVNLTGYVKFNVKQIEERFARNPQNGEQVKVPAHRQVRASIGNKLKQAVR